MESPSLYFKKEEERRKCLDRLEDLERWIYFALKELEDEILCSFIVNIIEEKLRSPLAQEHELESAEIDAILEPYIKDSSKRSEFIKELFGYISSLLAGVDSFYEDRHYHHHYPHYIHRHPSSSTPPPSPPPSP